MDVNSSRLICLERDEGTTKGKYSVNNGLILDKRILRYLRKLDDKHLPSQNYLLFQTDLKPYMRRTVANWMTDVCDEQGCHEDVLLSAINYLDRTLAQLVPVKRTQLQVIAAACMFIASKFRDTNPISIPHLVMYTDYSVRDSEILQWEILILQALKWDLSCVSPYNFLDQYLPRLPLLTLEEKAELRRHSSVLIVMCSVEPHFAACPPSLISAAALCSAAYGVLGKAWCDMVQLRRRLAQLASLDQELLKIQQESVEQVMRSRVTEGEQDDNLRDDKEIGRAHV